MTTARITLGLMVATLVAGNFSANAQGTADGTRSRLLYDQTNHIRATVEDIDYTNREVTLREPDGFQARFAVSEAVKNFPQMKKGDVVNVGYRESVLLSLRKPGEIVPPAARSEALLTREPGQKPGGRAVAITDITATVEDVDRESREVTLRGPDGRIVKVLVDPSVGDLKQINKGDRITARRTEELILSVEAP